MLDLSYKIWLQLLRGLIYAKRSLVWLLHKIWRFISWVYQGWQNTVGFKIYKFGFKIKQLTGTVNAPWTNRLLDFFSRRLFLELMLLVVGIILVFPHSQLFASSSINIPGRQTVLYKMVGPGEQDFNFEEVKMNFQISSFNQDVDSWRAGAVITQNLTSDNLHQLTLPDLTSISAGGGALVKPNIMPGADLPALAGGSTGRTEVFYHRVEAGETLGQISEKYNISLVTVLWANNLTVRSYIRPGDNLKILPVSGLIYKIKKGDTLNAIAKLYNSQKEKIIEFNKLKEDGTDLVIGEEILIPDGVMPTPVYIAPKVTYTPPTTKVRVPTASAETPAGSGYLWPTAAKKITQYYGLRHSGLDIAGPVGTAIYATRSGTVLTSQCGWNGGYGCYIIIDHGGGVHSLYGHGSRLLVSKGENVSRGDTIMLMGSTGRSTGSHVHFEIRINGGRLNPLGYIR